jgi:hypothetical protein
MLEQDLEHERLPVVERQAHRRDAVLARAGEQGIAAQQPRDGVAVARLDGRDQVALARHAPTLPLDSADALGHVLGERGQLEEGLR